MADLADSKQRNIAFLRRLEQQRLQKPCTKIIDLRGKVVGECQAYSFGGLTHYLDDRAYLLAKQLLDRCNGRYTIGVNEALLKALKSLAGQPLETHHKSESKPILLRDKDSIQFIAFDTLLARKEPRIYYTTAIELRISDVLYHASTVDITTSSIRIVMKRAFTLSQDDSVTVNFTEFCADPSAQQMARVNYSIFRVEQDDLHSYAILVRQRDDDSVITQWLDNWSQQHNTLEHLDLDDLLLNLASHYYLRLFTATLTSPLFWLSDTNAKDRIQIINLSNSAKKFDALRLANHAIDFSVVPFDRLLNQQRFLLIVYPEDNHLKSAVIPTENKTKIADALVWSSQHKQAYVLLLQTQASKVNLGLIESELDQLKDLNTDSTDALVDRLSAISHLAVLTDISASCQNSMPAVNTTEDHSFVPPDFVPWQGHIPKPSPICPYINSKHPRYFIKTAITLNLNNTSFDLLTNDVSITGVSLSLNGYFDIEPETNVNLNFTRWQSQTKAVKLNAVPYTIKRVDHWQGTTTLGLERNINACAESINRFFIAAIDRNKTQLAHNDQSYFVSQQSRVLNDTAGKILSAVPLYFGMDANNKRILQAIAANSVSDKYPTELWYALQQLVTVLSEQLKLADNRIQFGLYCHSDNSGNWHLATDYHLTKPPQKAVFINRALHCQQFYFFHCSLSPIKSVLLEQQDDLNQQLVKIRHHSSHKVKQIREVLTSLFAIGELNDITDILTAVYH
ncbi:MAG: PilZ domain-containing protein [Gammaproteobacteria bacterium]|nr:PilZ domain-containing protein [Gammaproteobacteria bacterium]